jgi:hypothetical protein
MDMAWRRLRDALSRYLVRARGTLTGRGRRGKRALPAYRPTRMDQLRGNGRIRPARPVKRPAPYPVRAARSVGGPRARKRR